ncbi:MAG: hypothetical protein ACK4RF_01890 [Cyclobacteriaceae bacterium]
MIRNRLRFVTLLLVVCFSIVAVTNRSYVSGSGFLVNKIVSGKTETGSKNLIPLILEEKEGEQGSEKHLVGFADGLSLLLNREINTSAFVPVLHNSSSSAFHHPLYLLNRSLLI